MKGVGEGIAVTPSWLMKVNSGVSGRVHAAEKGPEEDNRQTDRQTETILPMWCCCCMMVGYMGVSVLSAAWFSLPSCSVAVPFADLNVLFLLTHTHHQSTRLSARIARGAVEPP